MADKNKKELLEKYIAYFENISIDTIDHLDDLVLHDVRFVDPFQEVTGVEEMKYVLSKMFDDVDDPEFTVTDWAIGQDSAAYLRWRFVFKTKKGKEWRFRGVSEVHFSDEGKIKQHIDHWDSASQLYEKIPGVGPMVNLLKKKVSA